MSLLSLIKVNFNYMNQSLVNQYKMDIPIKLTPSRQSKLTP